MIGDPREVILKDIKDFTHEALSEGFLGDRLTTMYRSYGDHFSDCLYLIMVKDLRILVYGMDKDKSPANDYTYLFEDDVPSPMYDKISLFCRCLELDNHYELSQFMDKADEYFLDAMEDRSPTEGENNEDFFLRNAIWLMNPVIH